MSFVSTLPGERISGRVHGVGFDVPVLTRITPSLWMGGIRGSRKIAPKLPPFFRHVINLYPKQRYRSMEQCDFVNVRMADDLEMPDASLLEGLARYVNDCRLVAPTLVHCQSGLNRSGLVVGLALIRDGLTAEQAITLMREQRSPAVLCNPVFEAWLREH